jgi:hypothetical protein
VTQPKKKRTARVPAPAIPTQSRFRTFEDDMLSHLGAAGAWLRSFLRHRTLLVWLVPMFVFAALWATDPDGGASVKVWAIRLLTAVIVVSLAHWAYKATFDYPEADRQNLLGIIQDADEGDPGKAIGAGLALIALSIALFAFLMAFATFARADTLELERAKAYLPMLTKEVQRTWPAHPDRKILAGQISNEPPARARDRAGCPPRG